MCHWNTEEMVAQDGPLYAYVDIQNLLFSSVIVTSTLYIFFSNVNGDVDKSHCITTNGISI